MVLGIAIFAGLLILSFIYLYTQTKDRWNWSRIIKRIFIIAIAAVGLPILAIAAYFAYLNVQKYWGERPKVYDSFGGLTLGEKVSEVEFRHKLKDVSDEVDAPNKRYELIGTNISFDTNGGAGKVNEIIIACGDYDDTTINGIKCAATSEDIFAKYGKKDLIVLCKIKNSSGDNSNIKQIRRYESPAYGISYGLYLNKVEAIIIKKPEMKESIKNNDYWKACD